MPTYEYERADGTRFEIVQKITEEPLKTCPTTGQSVKRLVSAAAFHLKGTGWYKTDYASSSSGGTSSSSTSSTTPPATGSTTAPSGADSSSSGSASSGSTGSSGGCGSGSCGCKSDD